MSRTNSKFSAFLLIAAGLALLGCLLFFGGRFLYGLGQTLGADLTVLAHGTPTNSPVPSITPTIATATITITSGPSPTPTFYYNIPTATAQSLDDLPGNCHLHPRYRARRFFTHPAL
ncbi:MAG: hypothetical protein LC108_14765 [Anaerolineales bacterium]|nr:hypothetical protein [Anaerolineales bacterium]